MLATVITKIFDFEFLQLNHSSASYEFRHFQKSKFEKNVIQSSSTGVATMLAAFI